MVTGMQAEGMNRLVRSLISLNQTGVRRVRLHLAKTTETDNVREAGSSCGIQVEKRLDKQYSSSNHGSPGRCGRCLPNGNGLFRLFSTSMIMGGRVKRVNFQDFLLKTRFAKSLTALPPAVDGAYCGSMSIVAHDVSWAALKEMNRFGAWHFLKSCQQGVLSVQKCRKHIYKTLADQEKAAEASFYCRLMDVGIFFHLILAPLCGSHPKVLANVVCTHRVAANHPSWPQRNPQRIAVVCIQAGAAGMQC